MKKEKKSKNTDKNKFGASVSKIGNFNRSSLLHSSYVGNSFAIICQGDQLSGVHSKQFCQFLQESLEYYLNQVVINQKEQLKQNPELHKKKMFNFIVTCREQFEQKKYPGSFTFCFYYKLEDSIYCVRSQGLQIYLLNISKEQIEPLADSEIFPFRIQQNQKQKQKGYFYLGMFKMKGEYIFEDNEKQSPLYYQKFNFDSNNQDLRLLLGSSECFALLAQDYVKKHFKAQNKSLLELADGLLDQVKKKWRKIYQKDITFICCYV